MTAQKFVPKLFQGDMVRAIMRNANPKTQTRRGIKHSAAFKDYPDGLTKEEIRERRNAPLSIPAGYEEQCIKWLIDNYDCKAGDIIYVRETWSHYRGFAQETEDDAPVIYRADEDRCGQFPCLLDGRTVMVNPRNPWRPGIHMPKVAARIFLLVKSVRVERLQDISPADAIAEGIESTEVVINGSSQGMAYKDYHLGYDACEWYASPVDSYRSLWDKINGCGSFKSNPWVYVIEFEWLRDFKNPWA